jgi:ribonuclease HI
LDKAAIEIYTDGSCHTGCKVGAWASVLLIGKEKVLLKGIAEHSTNNRMELMAVIKAIEFIDRKHMDVSLLVYTDSQYVFRIPGRIDKLKTKHFLTNKGTLVQNADLVQAFIHLIETHSIDFRKVKAHQRPDDSINYNREVDKIAREMVRDCVKQNFHSKNFI